MAIKYREAEELRRTTRENLTRTPENWMRFLRTASNTYKYSYQDQLMISAQYPDATAVASFDVWSDRFGRRIRKGEKGIGLIDNSGSRPKMKYVFDIAQSDRYRDVPQPYVWDLQEENNDELILSLAGDLSIPIEQAVSDFCENTVDSLLGDYENVVIANLGNSSLAGQDENTVREGFREAVLESVKFVVLTRCGLDTDVVNKDVFSSLSSFSDGRMTDILGNALSNISEQALREIETTVKTIERRNQNEYNTQKDNDERRDTLSSGRGDYDILSDHKAGQRDRFDVYSRPGNIRIPSEPDSRRERGGRSDNRQMGTETQEISDGTQELDISRNGGQSHPDSSPDRDRQRSGQPDGNTDRGNDEERGREREAESGRSDGVGTPSELDTEQSGRNSADQTDIRITQKQKRQRRTKKAEEQVSPAFSSFPVGEQMSLFANEKSEQDIANEYAMQRLINSGTGFEDGKFRIAEYFAEEHTKQEKAKFLSDEYGWSGYTGGSESMDYRPGKGITMSHTDKDNPENNITVHLTYPQVVDMIDYLIQNDRYITPADIEKRQQRAIYYLKNYDPNNPIEAVQIEKAKAILDSYNIDYSQLLADQPIIEEVTLEEVEALNAAIADDADIPAIDTQPAPAEPEETVYIEKAEQVLSSSVGEQEEVSISLDDIALLQTIEPRKSVLNFSDEELALTFVWSKRFESDIKEKSPFFRA